MSQAQQKLQQVIDLSLQLNQTEDLDVLLEKVLSSARQLVSADAGYIYVIENDKLYVINTFHKLVFCFSNDPGNFSARPGRLNGAYDSQCVAAVANRR